MRRTWVAAALIALTPTFASFARADEPQPIIVLIAPRLSPFETRMRAELESMGFKVIEQGSLRRELPAGAVASARITGGRVSRIEIRATSDVGGGDQPPIVIEATEGDVGSIQAAERVRAFFQPLAVRPRFPPAADVSPSPPSPPPLVPPAVPTPAKPAPAAPIVAPPGPWSGATNPPLSTPLAPSWSLPRSKRSFALSLSLGVDVPLDLGGVGLGAMGTLAFAPEPWLRLEPFVEVPILPSTLAARGGSAHLYKGLVGVDVTFAFHRSRRVDLFGGFGAAGIWLRANGQPDRGFAGHSDDAFSFAPLGVLLSRLEMTETFSLVPRAMIGVSLPAASIQFSDTSAGRWGLPFGGFSVSFEAAIFR